MGQLGPHTVIDSRRQLKGGLLASKELFKLLRVRFDLLSKAIEGCGALVKEALQLDKILINSLDNTLTIKGTS